MAAVQPWKVSKVGSFLSNFFWLTFTRGSTHTRENSLLGEGDGATCAVFNQLWTWLISKYEKCFSVNQQPILQLIDNWTSAISYPLYRDFPADTYLITRTVQAQNNLCEQGVLVSTTLVTFPKCTHPGRQVVRYQLWKQQAPLLE